MGSYLAGSDKAHPCARLIDRLRDECRHQRDNGNTLMLFTTRDTPASLFTLPSASERVDDAPHHRRE